MRRFWTGYAEYLRRTARWWILAWVLILVWGLTLSVIGGDPNSAFVYTLG